jgi:Grx4 family monothiol glutaredoxin
MVFMKGTPDEPKCKFSRKAMEILKEQNIPFGSFNILNDPDVRAGIKVYSNWPTFPQFYKNTELMGGLDIIKEMLEDDGDLESLRVSPEATAPKEETINDRLAKLIATDKCMLFMKGSPGNEKCGFSRTIVGILQENGVKFSSFDILTDIKVRAGLKIYSNWPTFPQLYVDSELIGGLDIVRELAEDGGLNGELGLE